MEVFFCLPCLAERRKQAMAKVKETLRWVLQLIACDEKYRYSVKELVLNGLSKFSARGEGHPDNSAGEELVDNLENTSKFTFVGFAPNIMYVKKSGTKEEQKALWVHAFGTPTLVYASKTLPILVLANPGLRFNKSFLSEMKFNKDDFDLLGISG